MIHYLLVGAVVLGGLAWFLHFLNRWDVEKRRQEKRDA
jgi:hypothetical protein